MNKVFEKIDETIDTPCMLIDSARVKEILNVLSDIGQIYYPVKACAYPPLISLMANMGLHFNINSLRYLRLALEAGADAERLLLDNCLFTEEELCEAISLGVKDFAVDRDGMVDYILERVPDARLFLKLSASILDGEPRKYGADGEGSVRLYERLKNSGNLYGISFYIGEALFTEANVRAMCEYALSFGDIRRINVGGGFTANSFPLEYLSRLSASGIELIFEPGRGILGDACAMLTKVVSVDKGGSVSRIRLDASVYSGLMDRFIENKVYFFHALGECNAEYLISGYTSDSCDTFGIARLPDALKVGDRLLVTNCGPYSFDMSCAYSGARQLDFKLI